MSGSYAPPPLALLLLVASARPVHSASPTKWSNRVVESGRAASVLFLLLFVRVVLELQPSSVRVCLPTSSCFSYYLKPVTKKSYLAIRRCRNLFMKKISATTVANPMLSTCVSRRSPSLQVPLPVSSRSVTNMVCFRLIARQNWRNAIALFSNHLCAGCCASLQASTAPHGPLFPEVVIHLVFSSLLHHAVILLHVEIKLRPSAASRAREDYSALPEATGFRANKTISFFTAAAAITAAAAVGELYLIREIAVDIASALDGRFWQSMSPRTITFRSVREAITVSTVICHVLVLILPWLLLLLLLLLLARARRGRRFTAGVGHGREERPTTRRVSPWAGFAASDLLFQFRKTARGLPAGLLLDVEEVLGQVPLALQGSHQVPRFFTTSERPIAGKRFFQDRRRHCRKKEWEQ